MWIFLSVIVGIALWAAVASVVVALRDGYRAMPTLASAATAPDRNRRAAPRAAAENEGDDRRKHHFRHIHVH